MNDTVHLVTKFGTSVMTKSQFVDYCALRGWKKTGTKVSFGIKLADEIEGQPIYKGVVGPMYGGKGIVRYETPEVAYDLSR